MRENIKDVLKVKLVATNQSINIRFDVGYITFYIE